MLPAGTNTSNTPIEALERAYPMKVLRYRLRRGSGGAGEFLGGEGIERDLQMLEDVTVSLITERRVSQPWGLWGGEPGAVGENWLLPGGDEARAERLPNKCTITMHACDVLRMLTPGGGGWGSPRDARSWAGMSELYDALVALGVSRDEIEVAEKNGTLLALAAEHFLLPGERKFDTAEVAARCDVEPEALTKLWLALGFPRAVDDKVFTEQDVDVIRTFLRDGSINDYSLHASRIISASLGRVADVFVDEVWDTHRAAGQSEHDALSEMADGVDLERMERMLMYVLRRHLVSGFYRRSALHDQAMRYGTPSMAVGFADLAGFSTFSQTMSGTELASLIVEFERISYDLVAELDGRVVKTMGDGVLFTSDSPTAAADIALRLAALGDELPPVHVGLGWGPVLLRQGDCFGPTVNLASRVVGCAAGREVVIDESMATQLSGDKPFDVVALGDHDLKSFGPVPLFRISRASSAIV